MPQDQTPEWQKAPVAGWQSAPMVPEHPGPVTPPLPERLQVHDLEYLMSHNEPRTPEEQDQIRQYMKGKGEGLDEIGAALSLVPGLSGFRQVGPEAMAALREGARTARQTPVEPFLHFGRRSIPRVLGGLLGEHMGGPIGGLVGEEVGRQAPRALPFARGAGGYLGQEPYGPEPMPPGFQLPPRQPPSPPGSNFRPGNFGAGPIQPPMAPGGGQAFSQIPVNPAGVPPVVPRTQFAGPVRPPVQPPDFALPSERIPTAPANVPPVAPRTGQQPLRPPITSASGQPIIDPQATSPIPTSPTPPVTTRGIGAPVRPPGFKLEAKPVEPTISKPATHVDDLTNALISKDVDLDAVKGNSYQARARLRKELSQEKLSTQSQIDQAVAKARFMKKSPNVKPQDLEVVTSGDTTTARLIKPN